MASRPLSELGDTGLQNWGGIIREEFLRDLQGAEGYKRYNEMRMNSPVISALILAVEQSLRGVSWQVVSDLGEEDERIDFVQSALDDMTHSWNDHLIEALTMLPFGYSVFEIVYKRDGSRLVWRKFAIRGQDTIYRWLFDEAGGLAGIEQRSQRQLTTVPIPIEKLLLYRTRVERNNPEGRSILRGSWIPYYFAKTITQIEGIGIERELAGLPMIRLPETADTTESTGTSTDYGRAHQVVRNVRNDEQGGLVLPHDWEFSLISTGGTRQIDTDKVITRHESRMLMSALAQFLMLGQENVGSLALSKDQTDFFTMSVNATADIISETFSKFAITRLLELNGMDPQGISLEHSPAGDIDIMSVADFLSKTGTKLTWTATDELWLRQLANLPELTPEEIEEEREVRRAMLPTMQPGQGDDGDESEDEMAARRVREQFASSRAPDDDQRRRMEVRVAGRLRRFFREARKRITKGAHRVRR